MAAKKPKKSVVEKLREAVETAKLFEALPDDKAISAELAALYLNVSEKTLSRLRGNSDGPEYEQVVTDKDSKALNQKINYAMGVLRRYRKSITVKSTLDAADKRGCTFATIPDLLRDEPYWIQTIHSKAKGGMGRGTVTKSKEMIVGHVQTVSDKQFKKLLNDPNANVRWMSLDEAMSRPWADEEARQPFHNTYVGVLKDSIKKSKDQQEAATLRAL